ncbi:MAG: hypothetical protein AAB654_05225 [Acidobacteriota bacterium]
MNRIDLTGLRADLPIGAMAAFGCLRVCDRVERLRGSKLSWEPISGSFHAVLWATEATSHEELVAALVEDVKAAAGRAELTWSDQIKTATPETFIEHARQARDREVADWFAAFGSDLAVVDGKLEPTPFDMSVARQKFLADARKLAAGLAEDGGARSQKSSAEAYGEALFGPWRYEDDQHSLGWDPSTMKLGAFTYKAPTAMANAGVRAAVWLAFESLPLFPCFYRRGLQTRGFRRERRESVFCWPVWEVPISLATLRTLLGWAAIVQPNPPAEELRARSIIAIFHSARFKPNKYLASFRTPELAFLGGAR